MTAAHTRRLLKHFGQMIYEYQESLDLAKAFVLKLEIECKHTEDDGNSAYDVSKPPHYRFCTICGFPPHK